MRSKLRRWGNR